MPNKDEYVKVFKSYQYVYLKSKYYYNKNRCKYEEEKKRTSLYEVFFSEMISTPLQLREES